MSGVSTPDRTLLLLRHAKSNYPDGLTDLERPLAPRGVREAKLAGDWIREHAPSVDAILCSTANRTRETLASTGLDAPTAFVDQLYDSTPAATLEVINGLGTLFDFDVQTLLVVGHEPTTSELALSLTADGDQDAIDRMAMKFPTSAIAVLRTAEPWDQLGPRSASLVAFYVPR